MGYVIGIDYGTDSVRAIIANAYTGEEMSTSVFYYPRWQKGLYCDASKNQFRQHPSDYIEGIEHIVKACCAKVGNEVVKLIKAISIDTTGSTPVAVNQTGTPLALLPAFKENPNAMFILWKDHTAVAEAEAINEHAKNFDINYLQFVGGIYSSEWFWAKMLRTLRIDPAVKEASITWVEQCDWLPFLLTGGTDVKQLKRSICAAGHKALWASSFGGLPPQNFFSALDPLLNNCTETAFKTTYTSDQSAGNLSPLWAEKLGLTTDVLVGIGAFDAHMGAVGGEIEPYYLSKVMGTSTCDMLVAPMQEVDHKLIKGICGQVPGSIIPGMLGMEAGQSAFGDVYAWFKQLISWPIHHFVKDEALKNEISNKLIAELSLAAAKIPLHLNNELAIDWFNGRRTPDANQNLKGAIMGLDLASNAPTIFKALIEATCFGAKAIVERFILEGIPVKGLIGLGGVAQKSPYIMQTMADVTGMPIRIHKSEQTCAAGAAMFAATVAGIHLSVEQAMQAMGQGFDKTYMPNIRHKEVYAERYKKYTETGNFIVQPATVENLHAYSLSPIA